MLTKINNGIIQFDKVEILKQLINRRLKKEPIAYIINNKEFWSSNFYVDRSVLIPRPETEVLIDLLLSRISNKNKYFDVLDIGTGCGCILISLLKELTKAKGVGVDKSSKAITVAKKNSHLNKIDNRICFKNISLEQINFDKKFDIIISNPPYLSNILLKVSSILLLDNKTIYDSLKNTLLYINNLYERIGLYWCR